MEKYSIAEEVENDIRYPCLKDVIDMHIHIGPDAVRARRVDSIDAAKMAALSRMKAILLKNKQYITAPIAALAETLVPDIRVFGGICLDRESGGLNPDAVHMAAKIGAKIVWMPTETAANDIKKSRKPLMKRTYRQNMEGIRILDHKETLLSEVHDILDIIKESGMILGTGHLSAEEILILLAHAKERGLKKLIVNHPLTISFGPTASISKQKAMSDLGAVIEHTFVACMPAHDQLDPGCILEAIQEIGAEKTILSSDFGQNHNPLPVEGMRMIIQTFGGLGVSQEDLDLMTKVNPAKLLDL